MARPAAVNPGETGSGTDIPSAVAMTRDHFRRAVLATIDAQIEDVARVEAEARDAIGRRVPRATLRRAVRPVRRRLIHATALATAQARYKEPCRSHRRLHGFHA